MNKDTVSLLTRNIKTGEEKITEEYDRYELETWISHAKKESAEGVLEWEIIEED